MRSYQPLQVWCHHHWRQSPSYRSQSLQFPPLFTLHRNIIIQREANSKTPLRQLRQTWRRRFLCLTLPKWESHSSRLTLRRTSTRDQEASANFNKLLTIARPIRALSSKVLALQIWLLKMPLWTQLTSQRMKKESCSMQVSMPKCKKMSLKKTVYQIWCFHNKTDLWRLALTRPNGPISSNKPRTPTTIRMWRAKTKLTFSMELTRTR